MPLLVVWVAVFGAALVLAAKSFSRLALRVTTVVLSVIGILLLARTGRETAGAEGKPFREVVLLGAQEAGNDLTEIFGLDDVPVDAAAGVLVLLVLVYAYRKAEIVNARRTPGPVEVRTFTTSAPSGSRPDEGGSSEGPHPDPAAMEARMRQRLADANVLPPPSVPGGSDQEGLVEVMQKNPLVDVGGFGKILAFVARAAFPDVGYYVTGTLTSETATGGCGVTVVLNDSVKSSPVAVRTFIAQTYEQAVDSAAFFVAQNLLGRSKTLPEWQQWWDCQGLEAYHRGRQAVREEDWEEAAAAFAEAGIASPNNVHPVLEQAAVCELRDYHHEALVSYLTVLKRLPKLIEARYRLAVAYANADSWDERVFTDRDKRAKLCRAIDAYLDRRWPDGVDNRGAPRPKSPLAVGEDPVPRTAENTRGFYALAERELEDLKADLGRWRFVLWRIRSSRPQRVKRADALLLSSSRVIGGPRRAMLATVKTAEVTLAFKKHRLPPPDGPAPVTGGKTPPKPTEADFERSMEAVLGHGAGWQAYYNAACFYSMRVTDPPAKPKRREDERRYVSDLATWQDEDDNDRLARRGVEHLEKAFLDPGSEFSPRPAWIIDDQHGDHDLDKLRRHRRFRDWQEELRLKNVQRPPEQKEREELEHAWHRLAKVAERLADESVWAKLRERLESAAELRGAVSEWCHSEQQLWESFAELARRPQELARWTRFVASGTAARPAVCAVDMTAKGPRRSDWHDPLVTAAQHRASWRSLADTAAIAASCWKARASAAGRSSTEEVRCTLDAWAGEARGMWEGVARCSMRPLNRTLSDELRAAAEELAAAATAAPSGVSSPPSSPNGAGSATGPASPRRRQAPRRVVGRLFAPLRLPSARSRGPAQPPHHDDQ